MLIIPHPLHIYIYIYKSTHTHTHIPSQLTLRIYLSIFLAILLLCLASYLVCVNHPTPLTYIYIYKSTHTHTHTDAIHAYLYLRYKGFTSRCGRSTGLHFIRYVTAYLISHRYRIESPTQALPTRIDRPPKNYDSRTT